MKSRGRVRTPKIRPDFRRWITASPDQLIQRLKSGLISGAGGCLRGATNNVEIDRLLVLIQYQFKLPIITQDYGIPPYQHNMKRSSPFTEYLVKQIFRKSKSFIPFPFSDIRSTRLLLCRLFDGHTSIF